MKKFLVDITSLGTNNVKETRREIIIAPDFDRACLTLSSILASVNFVVVSITINELNARPFESVVQPAS